MQYWAQAGATATVPTVRAALARARELGLGHMVVATNSGKTIRILLREAAADVPANLVAVTHHVGFREPGQDEMGREERQQLEAQGVRLLTTTHLFANIERAITSEAGGLYPGGIVSATLRTQGQGMKVCYEIAVMALDAGLIPYGEDIVAVGGAGGGADTAVVIQPAHAREFFRTRLVELICMPRGKQG